MSNDHRWAASAGGCVLLGLLVAGCPDAGDELAAGEGDGGALVDVSAGDARIDGGSLALPDGGGTSDLTPWGDAGAETGGTVAEEGGLTCGEFGAGCTGNSDCCSSYCVETYAGFQCTKACVDECPNGFTCQVVLNSYPDVVTICVPNTSKLCHECKVDLQCNGGQCIPIGEGTYCTVDCSKQACPDGFECADGENGSRRCIPENGTCDCTAENAGAVRPCANASDAGICNGLETCDAVSGWGACDAPIPAAEVCDGVDNDCDGHADEDFKDSQPCEVTNEFGTCGGIQTCQGSVGFVCTADTPAAETCDFADNDCDGTTDEDFKTPNGKYGTLHHCGGCGKDCEGLFPNGTAACDSAGPTPRCVVASCAPGYYKSGDFQCLPVLEAICQPCTADFQCGGGFCITVAGQGVCSKPCAGSDTCGTGYLCLAVSAPNGTPKGQGCVPASGDCGCTPAQDGLKRPCTASNEIGECFGFQACDGAVGWGDCDAPPPAPEACNGVDDDCNGFVDDGLPPSKPCENTSSLGSCPGTATCFGSAGWVCNAPNPTAEVCDFKDNDCDGQTDETFKDASGNYNTNQHCGACGTSCANAIPNATAECSVASGTGLCVVSECAEGFYPVNPYLCLKAGDTFCRLCASDAQCDGKDCVQIGDANFCTDACTDDTGCPEGYVCTAAHDPDTGQDGSFCVPPNGTCDCNTDTAGAKRPCQAVNELGTCVGFQTCAPAGGWGTCSAVPASAETCDGKDNDCNGVVDDGLPPTQLCEVANDFGTCHGVATCVGSQGWVCGAPEPAAEACDFKDNDCDGSVDEDFKNAAGKYGSAEHCGTCNFACGGTIDHAVSEVCDASKSKPSCVVETCEEGYYRLNDFQCVLKPDVACIPCGEDPDCFGGVCLLFADGMACAPPCDTEQDCPAGFTCGGSYCLPKSGSCDCTEATAGVKRFCSNDNDAGTCVGFSVCNPQLGWSACDAAVPTAEICNGLDDDCNGIPDDGLPAKKSCQNQNDAGTCVGDALCLGSSGWVCQAPVPAAEICDFKDNDCDGVVDAPFKDAAGKYSTAQHCGACNQACGNAIANSQTETCDASKAVPQCIATACLPGYFLKNEFQCIPTPAVACTPCLVDDSCYGGKCVAVGDGTFCLDACGAGNACASGYVCQDGACFPDNGSCDCTEVSAGKKRTCQVANALGTCLGVETCVPAVGWSGCTASEAVEETCNGKDDDCNGLLDDGLPSSQVCFKKNVYGTCSGAANCYGSSGWVCLADEPAPESCDFKDNDCDGTTDEDYKDASGKYTTLSHCGTCNNACGAAYPNSAVEACDASKTVPQCIVVECLPGFIKLSDFQCIQIPAVACEPCSSDANCFGSTCAQVDAGMFCLDPCDAGACPQGFFCSEGLCRPDNGTCDCTVETAGAKRTCSLVNAIGTCFGYETCNPATGWGTCDAVAPATETCNGKDDDCNGFIDDGLPATKPCSKDNQYGSCGGSAVCYGTVGWFCQAAVPAPETCDFKDNDCDGQTDETFKDSDGKYSTDAHCGSCGTSCAGAILNGTATCDATKVVPQCVVETCGEGWVKYNDFLCVPITATLCEPCAVDENCVTEGARCVQLIEGSFCGTPCDAQADCPTAYVCQDFGPYKQCVPATGSCDCDGSNLDLQKACQVQYVPPAGGPTQTCFGTNYCTAGGWSGCTLPDEACNNLDDNCNGEADEDFKDAQGRYATDQHCGKCFRNCAALSFSHGFGVCDTGLAEPNCTMQCADGWFDTNANPADGCECEWQSALDFPDGTDWNCDGIDGELENAIFVSKNGSDQNPGTIALPKVTIQAGIDAAVAGGKRDVYVSSAVYSENITLAAGIGVYGGYSGDFQDRDTVLFETAIVGVETDLAHPGAVNARNIAGAGQKTVFDGFTVFGLDQQTPSVSSYALHIADCDARLRISNNRILSGSGGNGEPGDHGGDGPQGQPGSVGDDAADIGTCTLGGKIASGAAPGHRTCDGTVAVDGGQGGDGYCPSYNVTSQNADESGRPGANGGGQGGGQGYDGIMAPQGGTGGDNGPGCAGHCSAQSPNGCWCDSNCGFYGDCCNDACQYCGQGCGGSGQPSGGGACGIGKGCGSCIIPPNNLPMVGSDGQDGSGGAPGGAGQKCPNPGGTVANYRWVGGSGLNGGAGSHGGGGGGGGAGNGVQTCSCTNYGGNDVGGLGGGGGSGACGGKGGAGGKGGGGSFGIFLVFSTPLASAPLVFDNAVRPGLGGLGGPGGNGGVGGLGGLGGKGGAAGTGSTIMFCAGKGGNGGKGGDGGHAGGGGGGCGGASYGIFVSGQGSASLAAIKSGNVGLPGGAGGAGGPGGLSLGNAGQQGSQGAFDFTNF